MASPGSRRPDRQRFVGAIAGVGSTSGVRVVVGRWDRSPWGPFADVMVETADGHRVLLAPTPTVTEFVSATYRFDELREEPVTVRSEPGSWSVVTPSLTLELTTGGRTPLGRLVSLVPGPVAASPTWCAVTDPVARVALRGVRTRGGVSDGRRSYYGALDVIAVTALRGAFGGADLGSLADVSPPCTFGFSSVPRTPSVTRVVTTVDVRG
jgi:hypothetical protein